MKTANDIITYIVNEWCDYLHKLIGKYGVSVTVSEVTNAERTALEMYRIAANCFT